MLCMRRLNVGAICNCCRICSSTSVSGVPWRRAAMAKPGGSKKPMMKISLPPHSEEPAPPAVHPSLSAKGPGGSAKGTTAAHVDMPVKEKKKESPFVFSIDVLTSAISLPVTERTPARISMHLKEKYKVTAPFLLF